MFAAFAAAWIAHSAKISEFRQSWIDGLRLDIADFIGLAERWFRKKEEINSIPSGEKDKRERDEVAPVADEARVILGRIRLGLNPENNPDGQQDTQLLQSLEDLLNPGKVDPASRQGLADIAFDNARRTLKREWEKTKKIRVPRRSDFDW
ncbi:hypothetical protein [uncultured Rhodoblastus sp.]|uniref:hypothetical protein n=1 Tax=uncultured Rhodoblastus sp. TaxID=543037 RepID=UPI0025FDC913|nr:hypothetical protein [uncultured Rhodoblastus sp.]